MADNVDFGGDAIQRLTVGNVTGESASDATVLIGHLAGDTLDIFVNGNKGEVAASRGKSFGNAQPDPPAGAGDDDSFAFQSRYRHGLRLNIHIKRMIDIQIAHDIADVITQTKKDLDFFSGHVAVRWQFCRHGDFQRNRSIKRY